MMQCWVAHHREARVRVIVLLVVAFGCCAFASASPEVRVDIVEPPVPHYPPMAAMLGLEGYCEVQVLIENGSDVHVTATRCTAPVFCYSAHAAVTRAKLVARWEDGASADRGDIVYPLEYRLEGSAGDVRDRPVADCAEKAVS